LSSIIRLFTGSDPDLVSELVELQRTIFPDRLQIEDPEEYYLERLAGQENISLLLTEPDGELSGCLLAIPHSLAVEELSRRDPDLRDDLGRMYVEMVQIHPGKRHGDSFLRLIRALSAECQARGIPGLSMHARTVTGLSRFLQKIMAESRCLRRIDNWHNFGEPFDYLETAARLARE